MQDAQHIFRPAALAAQSGNTHVSKADTQCAQASDVSAFAKARMEANSMPFVRIGLVK
jgi:hypothetical protein